MRKNFIGIKIRHIRKAKYRLVTKLINLQDEFIKLNFVRVCLMYHDIV
jgi:hypothetical protein